jgi:NTE family protein
MRTGLRTGSVLLLAGVLIQAGAQSWQPVRVGLALSGGAALGLAHIGVLKVLEREGIELVGISGNSMGSMVGGVYAAGYSAAQIESLVVNADWGTLFSSGVPFGAQYLPERQQTQRHLLRVRHRNFVPSLPQGLVPLQNVEFLLMELLSEIEYRTGYDFDSLVIPYRAVAVDLVSGSRVVMKRGRLAQAIRASIAIPGVFAPELLDGMQLVDGGVQQYLPVEPLRDFRPDFTIAVLTMKRNPETGIGLIDVASRSMDIVGVEDLARQKALADVVIEPDVDPFLHSDFARAQGLIAAGESAAEAALPLIRAKLAGRTPVSVRRPIEVRPLSVVRQLRLEGLAVTRPGTVMGYVRTRVGAYLKFDALRQDLVRLFHTGLFEDVNYQLVFGRAESVDVVIKLVERAYGFYSVGIRYDSDNDVGLGLEASQGNLGGSGASVRAALVLGNPTELRFGLTGTRLFQFPFGYRLDGFWGSIDRPYFDSVGPLGDFRTTFQGGIAEAGYILGRHSFFALGFTACDAAYPLPRPARPVFESLPAHQWVVGPRFRLESNSHKNIDFPTRGVANRLEVQYSSRAMKATNTFIRFDWSSERVIPVGSRLLLRPGAVLGWSGGELAWAEMFHTGGDEFVGFAHGEFTSARRALLRMGVDVILYRLFSSPVYPVYLQLLSNVGSFAPWSELVPDRSIADKLHWGVGAGARANTPLGPIQLVVGVGDLGKPVHGRATRLNARFSFGREFRYTR